MAAAEEKVAKSAEVEEASDDEFAGPDITYVCKKILDKLKEKLKKNEEIPAEAVIELTFPEELAPEEIMVPVDMRGIPDDYDNIGLMVEKLGPKGTAEAWIKAAEDFAANVEKEPEEERAKPMTAAEWKKVIGEDGEDGEEEEMAEDSESEPDAEGEFLKAQEALKEERFFDGVQLIDSCVETVGKELSTDGDGERLLMEPDVFLKEVETKLTPELRTKLQHMFEVRGDMVGGLGAKKRAALDYACVVSLGADTPAIQAKRARTEEPPKDAPKSDKVPVTVITGFLGSGKTTLLNRILQENHGKRIAVIENEFGEVGIDDELIDMGPMSMEENIIEMSNGCICCTVRGDLIAGLKKLINNSTTTGKALDGVLVETSGLADPAPVAQTFFADDFVQKKVSLDGILTVVDAKHLIMHLDEEKPEGVGNEAVGQVAFADRILLNKCDLVDEAALAEVEKRIRMINQGVQIQRTVQSRVNMDFILGIEAFSLDKILEMDGEFLCDDQEHQHDDRVSSVSINVKGEVEQKKLDEWLGRFLREKATDVFRTKGILAVEGSKEKYVFQAVHMVFKGSSQRSWSEGEERICKLTFIGKNLNRNELEEGFRKCMAK